MTLDQFGLAGKVAMVTGCRTGLGQGMAYGLAEAGADIVGIDRLDYSETQARITQMGRRFLGISADLSSLEPIEGILLKTVSTFGKLDILVNNAGTIRRADAIEFTEKDWDDVMNLNIKTLFFLSQAAARQFLKQKTRGKIINVASMLSFQGGIRVPSYTASKSGVMGVTRLMANEWAKHDIQVNAIAPGFVKTKFSSALWQNQQIHNAAIGAIPQKRMAEPEELTGIALYLASDASSYVTGQVIAIDGGATI